MSTVTLQPGVVTLIASSANNFRVENISPNTIQVIYADSEPAAGVGGWGTLPPGSIEVRVVGGNFYGLATFESVVSVSESATPA